MLHVRSLVLINLVPPFLKEVHLSLAELPLRICEQGVRYTIEDVPDPFIIVAIRGLQPANIIVRVADDVEHQSIISLSCNCNKHQCCNDDSRYHNF